MVQIAPHPKPRLVLVTGATGFVGRALCARLLELGYAVRAAVRAENRGAGLAPAVEHCVVGEVGAATRWDDAVRGADAVVHLVSGTGSTPAGASLLDRFRAVNVAGTEALANAAAAAGARHFLFLSTIKVNGEETAEGAPFTERDAPCPEDAYARSKWEAEEMLWRLVPRSGPALTVLRSPIVYGGEVRGNFLAMMKILKRGVPLPLASVRNRRSLVYVGNLVDAIVACMRSPASHHQTYLVSDGEDLSTPELIRRLAAAMRVVPRLFPFPPALLACGATLLGQRESWRRLGRSLEIDSSRIRRELAWTPPHSTAHGLAETARWFGRTMEAGS